MLLTTFLRTLPKVWGSLMELLDPEALRRLDIRNVDMLARSIVASAHSQVDILDDSRRRKIVAPLIKRHGLAHRIGDNEQLLLDEFDAFLAGRGIEELEPYLALRRRGHVHRRARRGERGGRRHQCFVRQRALRLCRAGRRGH